MTNLNRYISDRARQPFAWGRNDCALFAAGWVKAATGRDLTAGMAGRYTTQIGAARVLKRLGYADQVAMAAALLPERRGLPRTGDIVVVDADAGQALGICTGEAAHVLGPNGIQAAPISAVVRAFEVR